MSIPSLQEFERIISGILSPDNNMRQQAEEYFISTKQNPDYCVSSLLQLVRGSQQVEVRSLTCVLLRKCISKTDDSLIDKLSPQVLQSLRTELMQAVLDEKVESIRHKLVYALSGFVGGLEETEYADFFKVLFQWTKSPAHEHRESGFGVFNQLATHMTSKGLQPFLPMLLEVLNSGMNDQQGSVRIAAIEATCSIVMVLSKSGRQQFQQLIGSMLTVLAKTLNESDYDAATTVVESFIEIAVQYPAFFKHHATTVIGAMFQIAKTEAVEENVRHLAMEYMVSLAESSPAMVKKIPSFVDNLFPLCMQMMVTLEDEKEWYESFEDDDNELTDYDVGLESLDRMSLALGGELVQPVAFKIIPQFLGNGSSWQHRHAGLMAIAQTAEGCSEQYENHLKDLVSFALRLFKDAHPRVRYAAIHCTAQLCTDFSGTMQSDFHDQVVPSLLGAMDDQFAKVSSHAATAVVNFADDCEKEFIQPYLDALFTKLVILLKGGIRYAQEQALSAISALADCSQTLFAKYYEHIMPFLKEILDKATGKAERMLRARAIECVSLIGLAVGKTTFGPDAKIVMDLLMAAQQNLEGDDPCAHHILQAWSRIARILDEDFIPYLSYVMPPLLRSAGREPDVIVTDADEDSGDAEEGMESVTLSIKGVGDKRISIRTSILEEKSMACNMILNYCVDLKDGFAPYVEESARVMIPLLKFAYLEEIREIAANIVPELLRSIKSAVEKGRDDPNKLRQLFEFSISTLMESLKMEPEVRTATTLVESLADSVTAVGKDCLSQQQIEQVTALAKELLMQSVTRREDIRKSHSEEFEDEEDQEQLEEDLMIEEDFISTVGELVGSLLKTHDSFVVFFVNVIYPIYAGMLNPQLPSDEHRIALCVMCDFVEHGQGAAAQFMTNILPAFLNYSVDQTPEVRQAAVYGIGTSAQFSSDIVNPMVGQMIQALVKAITGEEAKQEAFKAATANAVSALFKIVQFRSTVAGVNPNELLSIWFNALPVTGDYLEAQIVHKHFIELVQQNNPVILGQNLANLPQVLRVIANITLSELVDEDTKKVIPVLLKQMQTALPAPVLQQAWGALTEEERKKLGETLAQ